MIGIQFTPTKFILKYEETAIYCQNSCKKVTILDNICHNYKSFNVYGKSIGHLKCWIISHCLSYSFFFTC